MRPLIIANIEKLEETELLVARLYGENGQVLDEIVKPYIDEKTAKAEIVELMLRYEYNTAELYTSTPRIYKLGLKSVGLATSLKHKSDTTETERAVQERAEILKELYEIQTTEPETPLPKWRAWLIGLLENTIQKLKGEVY